MNLKLHKLLTIPFILFFGISGLTILAETVDELFKQGGAAYDAQRYSKAERIWQKIIELDSKNGSGKQVVIFAISLLIKSGLHRLGSLLLQEYHYNLGLALRQQGKVEEAIKNFQKAIEINPKYALAYQNLGHALHNQGKVEEAIKNFQKAIEINPEDDWAYYSWGHALRQQGKLEEAIKNYQKAIEINPKLAD